MSTVALRPCRPEDVDAVLALWQRAEAVPRPTDRPDALHRRLARDRELFILAWDGDRLIGSLMGGWDGWRGQMYRLAIDPDYRRQGIARQLVDAVEAGLRALGAERITSLVFTREPGAAAFWQHAGYEPDPATARYTKDLPQALPTER
jgi:ribosomal protein S18 acetylase RimI-like enzyme